MGDHITARGFQDIRGWMLQPGSEKMRTISYGREDEKSRISN